MMKSGLIACAVVLMLAACGKSDAPAAPSETTKSESAPVAATKTPEPVRAAPKKSGPWEGPLGVKMGITLDELRNAIELKDGSSRYVWESSTSPSPHDSFETYLYTITEETGLCKFAAVGKTIRTSVFGSDLKREFTAMQTALTERYGKPYTKYDSLRRGSIWNESNDWMMALLKKERLLASFWVAEPDDKSSPKADLPNDIDMIVLEAEAEGTDSGHVVISYAFKNESTCVDLIKKSRNKSL